MILLAGAVAYVGSCAWLVLDLAEEAQDHRTEAGGLLW